MVNIFNVRVYGLEESLIASGYPMIADEIGEMNPMDEDAIDAICSTRGKKLGTVPTGTGHDNFLKGIIVQFDITYPNYWTPQFQRYHFADIVSSTSKMHRINKMNLKDTCNKYVDDIVIDNLNAWIKIYNDFEKDDKYVHVAKDSNTVICYSADKSDDEKFKSLTTTMDKYEVYMKIISNTPMGLEQTMRVTTSYLQLKTIYLQRRYHKLKEDWGNFCNWVVSLPRFEELCLKVK